MMCLNCISDSDIIYKKRGEHIGIYCSNCGAWIKWIAKEDLPKGIKIIKKPENKPLF